MEFLRALLLLYTFIGVQEAQICPTHLTVADDSSSGYKYGETVHFKCQVNTTASVSNNSAFYILNLRSQTKFPITNISDNIGFAHMKVVSKESEGFYSCRYDNCTVDTLITIFEVKVDKCSFPRQNSTKAPEIICKVNDLYNMTCNWKPLMDDGCTMWQAMYKSGVMDRYTCCSADGSENCTSSSGRRHCNIPNTDFYRYIPFNITLIVQESNVYHYTVIPNNTISTVDISNEVKVVPGVDAYTLVVEFTLHHSPASVGGMDFLLSYSTGKRTSKTFEFNQTDYMYLDMNVTLDQLTPDTRYTVNISCKPLTSKYWGNQVTGTGTTNKAVHVARRNTNNDRVAIYVLCAVVGFVCLIITSILCLKKRIQMIYDRNRISDDLFTEDLLESPEHTVTQSDNSSESSDSSGIYSISRSVSDESDRDDQTNIKTLQIDRERMTVAFDNPLTATPIRLPLPILPDDVASDSDASYSIASTGETYEQYKLQPHISDDYKMVTREITRQLGGNTLDQGCLHDNDQQRNCLPAVSVENVVTKDDDETAIHATKSNQQESDGYEIAGGLVTRELESTLIENENLQDNVMQRDISHIVVNTANDNHDGEKNSFNETCDSHGIQYQISESLSAGEYFKVVTPQIYDSDTNSNEGYLTAHINDSSRSSARQRFDFAYAHVPQRQANAQVNSINSGDLPYIRNDYSTQSTNSYDDYVTPDSEATQSTYACDDYVIDGQEDISESGLTSIDEYCRADAYGITSNLSSCSGFSSNHSEHFLNIARSPMGVSSSESSDDTDIEPLEDYLRLGVSSETNEIDGTIEN